VGELYAVERVRARPLSTGEAEVPGHLILTFSSERFLSFPIFVAEVLLRSGRREYMAEKIHSQEIHDPPDLKWKCIVQCRKGRNVDFMQKLV
jgi:hypothetical protein